MLETDERPKHRLWLKSALNRAQESSSCCSINCSTCGAIFFQKILLWGWFCHSQANFFKIPRYENKRILQIEFSENPRFRNSLLVGLSYLDNDDVLRFFEQLKFIFTNIYDRRTGDYHQIIDQRLFNTPAGMILEKMKEHHRLREIFRSCEAVRNDPVLAQARRQELRESRAIKHAARVEFFAQKGRNLGFKRP